MIETDKLRCRECYWTGKDAEALKAANPFRVDELIYGCPECKQINMLIRVCDEKGCWKAGSCGFKSKSGKYRNTCTEHKLQELKTQQEPIKMKNFTPHSLIDWIENV